jgi:hypothetical protein
VGTVTCTITVRIDMRREVLRAVSRFHSERGEWPTCRRIWRVLFCPVYQALWLAWLEGQLEISPSLRVVTSSAMVRMNVRLFDAWRFDEFRVSRPTR